MIRLKCNFFHLFLLAMGWCIRYQGVFKDVAARLRSSSIRTGRLDKPGGAVMRSCITLTNRWTSCLVTAHGATGYKCNCRDPSRRSSSSLQKSTSCSTPAPGTHSILGELAVISDRADACAECRFSIARNNKVLAFFESTNHLRRSVRGV